MNSSKRRQRVKSKTEFRQRLCEQWSGVQGGSRNLDTICEVGARLGKGEGRKRGAGGRGDQNSSLCMMYRLTVLNK